MSVQYDASRGDFIVRWRQDGRHRKKRFKTERDAVAFEQSLSAAPGDPTREFALSAMEARLAELEARLAAVQRHDGPSKGGVYAYMTKAGRRWYFKYRHADGSSSSRRGFKSRRAALQARQALAEGVRRGEVKASRETFAEHWTRFLAAKKPYVTRGTLVDYEIHGAFACSRPSAQRGSGLSSAPTCGRGSPTWRSSSTPATSGRRRSTTP